MVETLGIFQFSCFCMKCLQKHVSALSPMKDSPHNPKSRCKVMGEFR